MKKKIQHILTGREKQITKTETVLQPLPHQDFRFANPFIVLHHLKPQQIAPGGEMRIHPHPHRGFAPVTFMLQGEGYHQDSLGHNVTVSAGDVQWMFAGKGILHSEGPSQQMLNHGGAYELLQLWVNVPRANKLDEPFYQSAKQAAQPQIFNQDGVDLHLVSGQLDGQTGPLKSFTPVTAAFGEIKPGKTLQIDAKSGYWTLIYVAKGSLFANQENVDEHQLIVFEKENEEIIITAVSDAVILYLSAEPIDEPVAARDNYVMNTQAEIDQAIADYATGAFGKLES